LEVVGQQLVLQLSLLAVRTTMGAADVTEGLLVYFFFFL